MGSEIVRPRLVLALERVSTRGIRRTQVARQTRFSPRNKDKAMRIQIYHALPPLPERLRLEDSTAISVNSPSPRSLAPYSEPPFRQTQSGPAPERCDCREECRDTASQWWTRQGPRGE